MLVLILIKNFFFFKFVDVITCDFLFIVVNGASCRLKSSDIWVTGCNYVGSVNFCGNYFQFIIYITNR